MSCEGSHMSAVVGNGASPGRGLSTTFRLCSACLQELPLDQFRPRGHGSEKRHSWCRDCRNAKDRERRFVVRARRERRRVGHLLTAIKSARSEREVAHFVAVMLKQFNGLSGFAKAYAAYHRFALEEFGRARSTGSPLLKSIRAVIECLKYCDDRARTRLPQMTDAELREQRDGAILEMVAADPELLLGALRDSGWTVQPRAIAE
jgi:hypothetical protein